MASSDPSQHRSKRTKCMDAASIVAQLSRLRRSQLEEVAKAAVESSDEAFQAAAKVLVVEKTLQHCVRCHEDYDPENSSGHSCAMEEHDEDNGMIESGKSGRVWLWPCCEQDEATADYCWIGSHISSWEDGDDYWKDEEMVKAWKHRDTSECFECKHGDGWCTTCCTCGGAGND